MEKVEDTSDDVAKAPRKAVDPDGGKSVSECGDVPAASPTDTDETTQEDSTEAESRAIAQAMASADASYVPSPSLLAADEPTPLLAQVDGPSLSDYASNLSLYQAKAVPVPLRTKLDVPIHVVAGGSVVDYEISSADYDIGFGVTAEREEGITNVKERLRVDSHLAPAVGKFLVGSVPCALVFSFDNEYSWFREKRVSYKITVTPPSPGNVAKGRRLRAKKALHVVKKDKEGVDERFEKRSNERADLEADVMKLENQLAETKKSLDVALKEEVWLEKRQGVRDEQIKMLTERLDKGWEDEKADA